MKIFDGRKIVEYRLGEEESQKYWEGYFKNKITSQLYRSTKLEGIGKLGKIMKKYFAAGGRILEGECGKGEIVYWLKENGFQSVGVDNNPKLVKRAKNILPDLPVIVGDVNRLCFNDNTFDGYYSGGVFEHFNQCPEQAIGEAYRVLKKGGILISSTPFLNSIRYIKAYIFKNYPDKVCLSNMNFHQYLFSKSDWLRYYSRAGFSLRKVYYVAGYAGLYHEIYALRRLDDLGFIPSKLCRVVDNSPISRFTGHSIICILKKD